MYISNNIINSMFQNVYFITGTAYAGKSTAVKLLSERYDGICCGENYHDVFMKHIEKGYQPNLSYFDTMKDWQEFISRTPDEYAAWIDGCSKEAESLEIIRLLQLVAEDKKIFVDTNISLETLREISDYQHIAVMLCLQSMSVDSFSTEVIPKSCLFLINSIKQRILKKQWRITANVLKKLTLKKFMINTLTAVFIRLLEMTTVQ